MKRIISIDFGTTATVLSTTCEKGNFEPEILEINAKRSTETVFRLDEDNAKIELFGREAWDNINLCPERTRYNFKPEVGKEEEATNNTEKFFKYLLKVLESQNFSGSKLKKDEYFTVVGYPADWSETQKKTLLNIAKKVGFPNVKGCEEPVGVINYYEYSCDIIFDIDSNILVYDFGGGTTDVCVAKITNNGQPELIGLAGANKQGGRDIDDALFEYYKKEIKKEFKISKFPKHDATQLKKYCRDLKEKFSCGMSVGKESVFLTIPILESIGKSYKLVITRDIFEKECKEIIDKFIEPIEDALRKAQLEKETIKKVIIAGGSARLYYVFPKLKEFFQELNEDDFIKCSNPQEVITKGIALKGLNKKKINSNNTNNESNINNSNLSNKNVKKKRKGCLIGLIIFLILLGGAALYFFKSEIFTKEKIVAQEEIIKPKPQIQKIKYYNISLKLISADLTTAGFDKKTFHDEIFDNKPDPYPIISAPGSTSLRGNDIGDSLYPEFNQKCNFNRLKKGEFITIQLFDGDGDEDDFIDKLEIPIPQNDTFNIKGEKGVTFKLEITSTETE